MHVRDILVLAAVTAGCDTEQHDASPTAVRVALIAEREAGTPCAPFAAGARVTVGEIAYRFERPRADGLGMTVPCVVDNLATAPRSPLDSITLVTRDGESFPGRLAHEPGRLAPGQRATVGYRFDVTPSLADGAVLYVHQLAYEPGRYGATRPIVRAHAVVDLCSR
jgi:hypothetical protein